MIGNVWRRLILGAGILGIIIMIVLWVFGRVHAQVTPGTINSKTLDGVGNKITSTVSGADIGLDVNCLNCGAGGATYLDADGIANQTASAVHGQTYMYNGATWDRVRGSIAGGLQVNCVTGCSGGSSTPTDAFANPTTAGLSQSFGMVYNGATWDRLRGTIAGGVLTNISNASLAVTGTFFQATQPVSGPLTDVQLRATAVPVDTELPAAAALSDSMANPTAPAVGAFNMVWNGVSWDRVPGDATNGIGVTILNNLSLTPTTVVGSGNFTVIGNKTNNNAAPGATNVGILPCIATAVAPSNTEGNQVGCSANLSGATRVIEQNFISTANNDGACASGAASFTAIASNASRTWLAVWASPANTDDVYLKLGATATAADARFAPGQPLNFTSGRIYTGIIDAFPASGTQAVCVMELN